MRVKMRFWVGFSVLMMVAACGLAPQQRAGDILVIGDSVLAWNKGSGADVGQVIAAELGREVVSRAALGARIEAGAGAALLGLRIPDQLSPGPWNWVVMNGGANDLRAACGCTACDAEIDRLISADGTGGAIPRLIAAARSQGAQVLWMGYYQAPMSGAFAACRPALVEIERRIARHARARNGVVFVDAEEALDPADPALLASDRTHPSPAGSRVIGEYLARTIGEQG